MRQLITSENFLSQDGSLGLSFANKARALIPRTCFCGDDTSDNIFMISPRTSPDFLIFSAERGDARANKLTTGEPMIGDFFMDDGVFNFVRGVSFIGEFSL